MKKHCIYCDHISDNLTDEHIIPLGLGGSLVLEKSSCANCNKITSLIERHILRGHWLGIRRKLNTGSRRKGKHFPPLQANLLRRDGTKLSGNVPIEECPFHLVYTFFRPEVLDREMEGGIKPYARGVSNLMLKDTGPSVFNDTNGNPVQLKESDRIEYLTNEFTASNMLRFLAKIAHSFVIKERGENACTNYYLKEIILGDDQHAMRFIGDASELVQGTRQPRIDKFHSLQIVEKGKYFTVLIQLFSLNEFDVQPIYEVVVGEKHDS